MAKTQILRDDMIPDEEWLEQERPVRETTPEMPAEILQEATPEHMNPVLNDLTDEMDGTPEPSGGDIAVPDKGKDDSPGNGQDEMMLGQPAGTGNGEDGPFLPEEETPLKAGHVIEDNHGSRWEIVEFIGQGGFALTYKVKTPGTVNENYYILKEFCPAGSRRNVNGVIIYESGLNVNIGKPKFTKEPDRISKGTLKLGNLPKDRVAISITPEFTNNGNCYFVQEYVEGTTLMEFMKKPVDGGSPMTVSLALEIAEQLCLSVMAIHKQDVVHQDISPNNFIFRIKEDGTVALKVIDFGLSATIGYNVEGHSFITAGLPGFHDKNAHNIPKNAERKKVDVYSMAAVLNYMLFLEYESAGNETKIEGNWDSLENLNENQPFVMAASPKEEQKRIAIIRLIKNCIAPARYGNLYDPDFRPTADEYLSAIQKIKAAFEFDGFDGNDRLMDVDSKGGQCLIDFISDVGWEAECSVDWLKLNRDYGEKGGSILVTVEPNPADTPRLAEISITNTIHRLVCTISQKAGVRTRPDIAFPDGVTARTTFPNSGDVRNVTFTATDEWKAKVSSDGYGWITLNMDNGTAGTVAVQITAVKNIQPKERHATVTFTCGEKHIQWAVVQQPAENPFLKFVDGTITRHKAKDSGDTASFSFETNTDWFVSMEPKDAVYWIEPGRNAGKPGSRTLNIKIAANDTPAEREATVTVSNGQQHIGYVIWQDKPVIKVQPQPAPIETDKPVRVTKRTVEPVERIKPVQKPVSVIETEPKRKQGPAAKPVQPKQTGRPARRKAESSGNTTSSKWRMVIALVVFIGVGGYSLFSEGGRQTGTSSVEQPDKENVRQTGEIQPQQALTGTSPADSLDAVIQQVVQGKIPIDRVTGSLSPNLQIYERYGDNDVEVGSTLRQLLQRENNNIVISETHRVIELYTDPGTGLIDEIIIEKKK